MPNKKHIKKVDKDNQELFRYYFRQIVQAIIFYK
ncbi:hypothetical protein EC917_12435 [Bacillus thuringiensis]|uniref:Uncharacterized protein n=1 Tax=Bacillus thuringiensis TaxID=1428 RepID=A0A4R4B4P8_BACTU|nr:hypothetical protein EC917_12435 [Bacillus thuringiensis]TCW47720.1 hypothetical protein EC910_12335 [Bacillus thuringiensis]